MGRLSSRKLAAVVYAISGIVGLILGLAVIEPSTLTDPVSVGIIGLAIFAISGLGGFLVRTQGFIDTPKFFFEEPPVDEFGVDDPLQTGQYQGPAQTGGRS